MFILIINIVENFIDTYIQLPADTSALDRTSNEERCAINANVTL
jgi:hypothetical protein